nr:immunoglobulin light chain junction region [Macaca mulatta]
LIITVLHITRGTFVF